MFFTSSPDLPFQTIREVMRAYPEWNLMMKEYFDAYFDFLAELGDPDYKVWPLTQLACAFAVLGPRNLLHFGVNLVSPKP